MLYPEYYPKAKWEKWCPDFGSLEAAFKEFYSDSSAKWIFRGVDNPEYSLVPSIFRSPDFISKWLEISDPYPIELEEQIRNELRILSIFFEKANSVSLPIPSNWEYFLDAEMLRHQSRDISSTSSYAFKRVVESLALAQHHGIPTRLLDFTSTLNVALYFSCKDVVDILYHQSNSEASDNYRGGAIWALNITRLKQDSGSPLRFFTTPYSSNLNISKQDGLFVIDDRFQQVWSENKGVLKDHHDLARSEFSLDVALGKTMKCKGSDYIRKIIFPQKVKVHALEYLESRGFTLASLMPSYDNVREYLNKKSGGAIREAYLRTLLESEERIKKGRDNPGDLSKAIRELIEMMDEFDLKSDKALLDGSKLATGENNKAAGKPKNPKKRKA